MPFTLAHPAAVLPLRRYCPRHFNFPALVIGSVTPDLGYCFERWNVAGFSHSFAGSFGFDLPVGIALLVLFYGLRLPVIGVLPKRQRQLYFPLCQQPPGSPFAVVVSLLIGTWTHLLLDSFTHKTGWLVEHLPLLQTPLFMVGSHAFRVCSLIWYLSSFAGIAWLYFAFEQWKEISVEPEHRISNGAKLRNAFLVAFLILPVAAIHILVHGWLGQLLTAVLGILLVAGIALRR